MLCGDRLPFRGQGISRAERTPGSQARRFLGGRHSLRLVALPLAPGDDLWRYQWEGKIQRAGFNPYVHAPDDPKLEPVRAEFPDWHKINHRDFRAIYPPGAELLFAGLSGISDRPLLYKLLFAGARSRNDRRALAAVRRNVALRECGLVRLESAGRLQLRRRGPFRQLDDFADDRRDSVPHAF